MILFCPETGISWSLSNVLQHWQESVHHVGLYMAKERGAKIANKVSLGAPAKAILSNHVCVYFVLFTLFHYSLQLRTKFFFSFTYNIQHCLVQ